MFDIYASYRLMGAFNVGQTARLLARYHYIEAQLMRVAAGKLACLPEWEIKCLLGRHLWQDSLHANEFQLRLIDLRWPRKAPLHPGQSTVRLLALLDESPGSAALLTAIYRVVKPRLVAAYTAHLAAAAPLADEPTALILQRLIAEEQQHIREGQALLESLPGADMAEARAWQQQIEASADEVGSLAAPTDEIERELDHHFEGVAITPAPAVAARDARFRFVEDGFPGVLVPDEEIARFAAHRDADNEMHAAEVLGRAIYEHPEMPWDYHVDMARQCWDEVRHAVLYQRYLEGLGTALGDYPVIPGNYAYRMALDFPHRMYDLHLRGEKLGMPDLIRYREESLRSGDHAYALLNDYVHADEVPHVKNGRWLHWLLKNDKTAFRQIERETMQIRADYERSHAEDPLIRRYTGVSQALLEA